MAFARFPVVVLDCPDPKSLAEFYGALIDWRVEQNDDHWWSVRAEYGDSLGFQKAESFTPPQWPGQGIPQQMHLDVVVDDLDVAEAAVHELGATKHEHQPGTTFRVFLGPPDIRSASVPAKPRLAALTRALVSRFPPKPPIWPDDGEPS